MGNQQTTVENSNIRALPIITSFLIAGFIGLFSETALNMALKDLITGFGILETTAQWLTTGYLLTLGILVPISGLILQWFTTRQLFIASLVFSIIGTLIGAIAPTFSVLMIARIVQAVGTALLLPLMFNTILVIIPPHKRGRAMGIIGLVIMFAPAVGPTVSGLILKTLTWHWIFWISLPLLIIALVFGIFFMQNVTKLTKPRIDIFSIILSTIGFGGIVFGFSSAGESGGWGSLHVILSLVIGVVGLIAFSLRQMKMDEPMLDLKAFKYPMFVIGLLLILVCMMVLLCTMMILPLYLQTSLALSTFAAGLMLLPGGIINGILSPVMGGLFDRFGPKWLVIPGLVIVACALYGFSTLTLETSTGFIVALHIALMVGISMIMMPAQTNGLNQLPPELYPHGTAIMNTLQQVAGAIGTAVGISILSSGSRSFLQTVSDKENPLNQVLAFTNGVQNTFIFAIIVVIVGLIISFFIKRVNVKQRA
ncbi:TPA: multidrug efflux MFS transporter [Bacillus cereus]|uniref:DHA2 family efflux MFS transporter permease subunit n=1 Tax=Bacillus cereus TaxID=1396 RepID=A0A9X8J419_BACCE|nr:MULTISPECIES: DHA2 family efflux MFS transporter permease subunit [Bacillus]MCX2703875.1 DHA2 family efflux MFS transporter permease subunit [Bacillus sp. AS_5]KAB7677911.1 multidrug efflux MFS transporter [Bacillus sp. B1-WWTP-T-0.5-Post-4]MCW4655541.1 DHA2 family efflux MFS transporter permease subunit [Bacillus sp. AS_3]RWQ77992.1 DHA2 family efflux MFS transporter permease subunit [Bacillus cereus]HDR4868306.1 multidrug efflux MFS transporter [Bacillus cereus]